MNTLLTVEEFKLFFPSSSLSDEQILMYCEIATELVHELAGISLEEGEITETLKGNNQNTLYVKKRPIKNIIEISSNKVGDLLSLTVCNLSKTGVQKINGIFYQGQDINEPYMASKTTTSEIVKIKYLGGYKYPDEVPKLLKYALAGLINGMINDNSEMGSLKSYSRDDVSYTFMDKYERDNKFHSIIQRFISW